MKILFISQNIPFPPYYDGERLIVFNLIKELSEEHQIDLLSFAFQKELPYKEELSKYCQKINVFSRPSKKIFYHLFWFFLLKRRKIKREIKKFIKESSPEVIVVEGIFLSPLWEIFKEKPCILYAIDCFSLNLKRKIAREGFFFFKILKRIYLKRLESLEKKYINFKRCIVVSEKDKEALLKICPKAKISVIPNGVDLNFFRPLDIPEDFPSVAFSGVMNYPPNIDAALYFYQEILPLIKEKYPKIKYYIIGRNPVPSIKKLSFDSNVIVTGFVKDIKQYVGRASVIVVPIRSGSGIKNKILEAMAQKKAIVATPLSCVGIKVTDKEDIFIEETSTAFAKRVIKLLEDKELRERVGEKARKLVEEKYTWEKASQKLEKIIFEII